MKNIKIELGVNHELGNLLQNPLPIKERQPAINLLWSGGMDSTYLLLWLLSHGYKVTPHWIKLENNHFKNDREKAAKERIMNVLLNHYPELADRITTRQTNPVMTMTLHNRHLVGTGCVRLSQAIIWLFGSQFIEADNVCIGYVNGDDAIMFLDKIRGVIKSLNKMRFSPMTLLTPLEKINKTVIWEEIPKEIQKYITWCEMPESSLTCKCPACLTHRMVMEKLKEEYKLPEEPDSRDQIKNTGVKDIRVPAFVKITEEFCNGVQKESQDERQ